MLQNAGKELEKELSKVELSGLKIPYVTNVTAQYVTDISETKNLLARQISSSVLWQQSVEKMIQEGVDTFVEIGPGKTLAASDNTCIILINCFWSYFLLCIRSEICSRSSTF